MSGKKAEVKPSPLELAQTSEIKNVLFPAARDLFQQGTGGIYQGSGLAGQNTATLNNQRHLLNQFVPGTRQDAALNVGNLQSFFNPEMQNYEDILGTVGSVEDIYGRVPDLKGLYQTTVNQENLRSRNQINNLADLLGQQSGRQFERNILPALQDQAAAAGQFTSSKAGIAEGLAAADIQNNLDLQIGGLLQQDLFRQDALRDSALNRASSDRNAELNRLLGQRNFDVTNALGFSQTAGNQALQASSLYGSALQSQLIPEQVREAVGGAQDFRSQQELQDYISQFNAPRQAEQDILNQYASVLYGAPQFQQQTVAGSGSPLLGALGGASVGAEIGSLFGPGPGTAVGTGLGAAAGLLGSL